MEVDFTVHDTFGLTRPQWQFASNLEEAAGTLQQALSEQQKLEGADKTVEIDEGSLTSDSEDDNRDAFMLGADDDVDDELLSEDEIPEVWRSRLPARSNVYPSTKYSQDASETHHSVDESDSEEEDIVVTRQQEEVDPEDAADFEREFSRMMAESMESRKFERKPQFDVPIPVAAKNRSHTPKPEEEPKESPESGSGTMAFSLLTKKGKGQQVGEKGDVDPFLH